MIPMLLLAGVAGALGLVVGALLAFKKPVPAAIGALPPGLALGGGVGLAMLGFGVESDGVPLSYVAANTASSLYASLNTLAYLPLVVAASALPILLGATIAAFRVRVRSPGLAGVVGGLLLLLVLGWARDALLSEWSLPWYLPLVVLAGLLTVLSSLAAGDSEGTDAVGTATLTFFLFVVASAIGSDAWDSAEFFAALANCSDDQRGSMWAHGSSSLGGLRTRSWLSACWAGAIAAAGIGAAATPSGLRRAGAVLGFVWVAFGAGAIALGNGDMAWSASNELIVQSTERLPSRDNQPSFARNARPATPQLTVIVERRSIWVNGEQVANLELGLDAFGLERSVLPPEEAVELQAVLTRELVRRRSMSPPDDPLYLIGFDGPKEGLHLGFDRQLDWVAVSAVLRVVDAAGFNHIGGKVLSLESGAPSLLAFGFADRPFQVDTDAFPLRVELNDEGWRLTTAHAVTKVACMRWECDPQVLTEALRQAMSAQPERGTLVVIPADRTTWERIVLTMDAAAADPTTPLFPHVVLGGAAWRFRGQGATGP